MADSGLKTPQQTPSRSRTNSDPSSRLGLPLKSPASSSFQIHHGDLMTPSSTPSRKPLATPSKQNNLYDIIKTNAAIMSNSTSTWTDALQAMDKVGKMISSDEFKLLLKEDEPKALILYELLEKSILNHVPAKVSDLRAQVCRSACELTSHVVATMNDRASNFVRSVVPSLLKTLVKTNKVFQNFSNTAMLSIAKDCHFSSYASEVISGAMNKHPSLREKCIKYLLLALTKHSAAQLEDPDCMIDKAIEAVKECLADSKTDVRENAFKCFTKIELMWPEKSATLVESLDPTTLKQLRAVAAKSTTTTTTTASSLPSTRPSFRSVRQGASLTQDASPSTASDVEQKTSTSEPTISQTVENQEQPTEQEQTSSCAQTQSSEASTEAVDTGSRNTVEDQMLTTELVSLQIQTSTPPRMVPKLPLSEDILSNIADSLLLTPPASNSLLDTPLRGDDSSPLFVAQKQEPMLPNFDLAPTKLEMSPLFKPQTEPILPLDVSLPSFQLPEMDQQSTFNTDYISVDQMPVPVDNIEEAMEAAQLIPEPIVVSEIELTEANIEPTATQMIEETVEPIVEAEVSKDTLGAPQLLDFDIDSTPAEPEAVVEHSGAKILVDFDFSTPTTEGYEAGAEQPLEMQPSAPVVNWMDASLCEDMSYSPASTCEPTIYNPPVGECLIGDFDFSVTATPSKNKRMIDLTDTLKPTVVAELGISLLSDLDITSSNAATDSVSESISVAEVVESQESIPDVNAEVAPELAVPQQALEAEICETNEQLDESISDRPTLQETIYSEEVKLSEEIVDCDVEADQFAVPAEHGLQNEQQVEVDTNIQDDKTIEEDDKIEEDTNTQEDDTFEDDVNVLEESESVEEPLEAAETPISGAIRILVDQQDSEYLQDEVVPPVYSERRRHLSLSTIDEVSEPCTPHASPRLSILSRDFSHSAYASDDGFDSFDNFDDEFTQLMRSEVSIRSRSSLLVTSTVDDDVSSELDQYAQKHVPVGFSCTQFEQSIPSRPQIEDIAEMYENSEDENDTQESVDVPVETAFVDTQDHSAQLFNEDIAAPALSSASMDENSITEQQIEVIEEVNEMDLSVAEVDGTEDTAQIASDYGNLSIEDSAEATAQIETAIETSSNADVEEPCLSGDVATSELELVEEELKNVTIDETTTYNIAVSIDQIPDAQETNQQETNEELIDDYQTSSEMPELSNETADLSEELVVDALIPEVEKVEFVQPETQSFAQITSNLEQEVVASDPVAEIEELEVDEMEPDMLEDSTLTMPEEDLVTVEQEEVDHPVPHAEESVAEEVSMESEIEIVEETVSEVEIQAAIEEAAAEEDQVEEEACNLMAEHVDEIGISGSVELLAESTEVIEEDDNQESTIESVSVEIVSMPPNDDETIEIDQQEQETTEQATTVETLEEITEINQQEEEIEERITLVEVPEQTTEIAEPEEETEDQTTLIEAPEAEMVEINEPEEQTEDQTTLIEATEETTQTNEPEQETEEQIALIEVPEDTCVEDVKMDDAQEVPIVDNGVEQVEQQEETQEAEAEAEEEQSEEVEEELVKPTTRGRSKRTAAVAKKTSTRRRKATDPEPVVSVEPEAVKVDTGVAVAAEPAKTRGRGRKASTKEHESAVQAEVIEEKPLVQEVVKPALRGRTSKRNLIAEEHVELEAKDAQAESNQDEMEEAEEEKSATATRRGTRRATSSTVARRGRAKSSSVAVVSAEEEHEDEVETEIVEEIAAPVRRGRGKKATAAIQPQTTQDSTTVISDDEKHEQEEPEQVTAPRRGRGKKVAAIVPAVEVEEVEEPAPTKTRGRGRGRKVAATEEVAEEVEETIEEPAEEEQTEVRSTRRGTRTTKSTSATKSTVPSKASTVVSKSKMSTEEDKENSKRQTAKSTAQPLQAKVGLKEQSSEPKPSTPIANRVRARASRLK